MENEVKEKSPGLESVNSLTDMMGDMVVLETNGIEFASVNGKVRAYEFLDKIIIT